MGLRGPKPKPTTLKLLEGTYRDDRAARNEPRPRITIPRPPAWLTGVGRKEYRRAARLLVSMRVLTEADGMALALYAQQYARWLEAEEHVRKIGMLIKDPKKDGSLIYNPFLAIANTALKNIRQLMGEFGMTPAARTRISMLEEEHGDDMARALFRAAGIDAD